MTAETKKILLIEDNDEDAEVFRRHLRNLERTASGRKYEVFRAANLEEGMASYESRGTSSLDIAFLDLNLPGSSGISTVRKVISIVVAIPVVVLTTAAAEELGTQAIQLGAQDYLEKEDLDSRSIRRAIDHSIERFRLLEEKNRLIAQLSEARKAISELREIIPICSYCKNIRNDSGYWEQLESYLNKHMDAALSHGICPDCAKKLGL